MLGEEVSSGYGRITQGLVGTIKNTGKPLKGTRQESYMIHLCLKPVILNDVENGLERARVKEVRAGRELLQELRDVTCIDLRYILEEESLALGNGLRRYGEDGEVKGHSQISY